MSSYYLSSCQTSLTHCIGVKFTEVHVSVLDGRVYRGHLQYHYKCSLKNMILLKNVDNVTSTMLALTDSEFRAVNKDMLTFTINPKHWAVIW